MTIRDKVTPSFLAPILDLIPDAIIWVKPVFAPDMSLIDFEVAYSNKTADEGIKHPKGSLTGLCILKDGVPSRESSEGNFKHFLDVYQTGEVREFTFYAHHSKQQFETIRRVYEGGVLSTTRDRKAQREAERKEQEKTQLLNGIVDNAPVGIEVYESIRDDNGKIIDFKIKLYNEVLHELTGFTKEERASLTFKELLEKLNAAEVFERYKETAETGQPFSFEFYSPRKSRWLNLSVVKLGDGFMITISDITEIKNSQQKLKQHSERLSSILDSSLNAIFTCEAIRDAAGSIVDLRYTLINTIYTKMIGKKEEEVVGKTMLELFPTTKPIGVFATHCSVIETGISQRFELNYKGEGLDGWYDVSSVKMGSDGVVVTFADITEQKNTALAIQQQNALLDNILTYSSNGISVGEMIRDKEGNIIDIRTIIANDAAVKYTGIPKELYLSKSASELDPNFTGSSYFNLCVKCMETGEPFLTQYYIKSIGRWLEVSVSRMNENRQIYIFTDVTTIKETQIQLEEYVTTLKTVFDVAQTGMFTFAPVFNQNGDIIDFRFVMANPTIAAYVQQSPDALIGELGSRLFPEYLTNGIFEMCKTAYRTGEIRRQDINYKVRERNIYLDLQCAKIGDHVLVSFTDHTPLRQAHLQLEQMVDQLKRSNASLEEFAYAASHDLQEPLRKIHTFSDRLMQDLWQKMHTGQQQMFERILSSTKRMRTLIEDLLSYSQVSSKSTSLEHVELQNIIQHVLQDLEATIIETDAHIQVDKLPTVLGDELQLRQLFQNLVGNALKYRKHDITPEIIIATRMVDETDPVLKGLTGGVRGTYHLIEVKDNGIGFEQEYAEKIFQVFQRLHGKTEYEGTGVGLAIVQKVVNNHKGFITVESKPGEGSSFKVLLPA